jgi:hypothetical protein
MRGLLQIGIRVGMDSMKGFEEMSVKAVLTALKENQNLAQPVFHLFLEKDSSLLPM